MTTKLKLNPFAPGYEDHCVNVAQMISRIYDDVAPDVRIRLLEITSEDFRRQGPTDPPTSFGVLLDEIDRQRGKQIHAESLRRARLQAEEAVAHYFEITGAGEDET